MNVDDVVAGLFDYAGMFPPAALSFSDALRQSARIQDRLSRPRMVGTRMVLAASELPRLDDAALDAADWPTGIACDVCVVGVSLAEAPTAAARLGAWTDARANARVSTPIRSLELALAPDEALDPDEAKGNIESAREALPSDVRLYLEPRWDTEGWRRHGDAFWPQLAVFAAKHGIGLKVRFAGPTALDRPTFIHIARHLAEAPLPLKATQGLHHPILEPTTLGNDWGFLNLVTCLRFIQVHGDAFSNDAAEALLREQEPNAFGFDDGLAWRDDTITPSAWQEASKAVPFQIGTCSVGEPDQDLARLFGPATKPQ